MKKVLLAAVIASMVGGAAFAQTNVVTSANVVGYSKVSLEAGGKYTMSTCNFETGATNTLLSIFGTNQLTQSDSYGDCDRIFVWNAGTQTYQAWAQWTDGVFYKANDLDEWNQAISGNPAIPVGQGFFIASGSVSNTVYFSGDVVAVSTQSVSVVAGYQILANPFTCDIALQATTFADCGAASDDSYGNCDRIYVWNGSAYQAYALWTDGNWYKANDLDEWNQGIMATNTIALSQGFFYEAKAPITWVSTNTYLSAIQ
ncbi:MAG: hypothetical protein MUC65_05270 [Pontiellaceae bacterium]|nr:hypothetical protein [Pontiellaceae bacterium]